jgi:CRP-like cAMP-binding protein
VSRLCTPVKLPAGKELIREGSAGHEFFVVVEGRATVEVDGETVAVLGPGEFFGEVALLDGGARTASVTAETDLVVEVISHQEFFSLLLDAPSVTRRILRHLGARLRAADAALVH